MKKQFVTPEIEIIETEKTEIIASSGTGATGEDLPGMGDF